MLDARSTQHAARSTQHAARSTQHAARSTQHAARSTHFIHGLTVSATDPAPAIAGSEPTNDSIEHAGAVHAVSLDTFVQTRRGASKRARRVVLLRDFLAFVPAILIATGCERKVSDYGTENTHALPSKAIERRAAPIPVPTPNPPLLKGLLAREGLMKGTSSPAERRRLAARATKARAIWSSEKKLDLHTTLSSHAMHMEVFSLRADSGWLYVEVVLYDEPGAQLQQIAPEVILLHEGCSSLIADAVGSIWTGDTIPSTITIPLASLPDGEIELTIRRDPSDQYTVPLLKRGTIITYLTDTLRSAYYVQPADPVTGRPTAVSTGPVAYCATVTP